MQRDAVNIFYTALWMLSSLGSKESDRGAELRQTLKAVHSGKASDRDKGRKKGEKRIVHKAAAIKIHESEAGLDLCIETISLN